MTYTSESSSGTRSVEHTETTCDTKTWKAAKMTDSMLGITPRCFICQARDNLTLIEPPTYICKNHLNGKGQPYLENGGQID